MPNAKNIERGKKSILVYGPTGTGKTTMFTTLKGRKFLYIFDPSGVDAIAGKDITYETYLSEPLLGIRATKKGKTDRKAPKRPEPLAYTNFENHLEAFLDDAIEGEDYKGVSDFDVIGFDSLTTLSIILMDRLLFINARLGRVPEIADYLLAGDTLLAIFRAVTHADKTIFIVAHSELVQDAISKRIINQLDVIKNVRRLLPRFLTDFWVSTAEQTTQGNRFFIQTVPTKEFPAAKNSLELDPSIDVTVNLKQAVEGQGIGKLL